MEVRVPERVHMADLEAAPLARLEHGLLHRLPSTTPRLAHLEEPTALHEAPHRRHARHRAQFGLLLRERHEVVVVQLVGPARVRLVLLGERLLHRRRHRRVGPRVRVDLARELAHRVTGRVARRIEPTLDGRARELDAHAGLGGVLVAARRQLIERLHQCARGGGLHEERAHHLKAKASPSHTR